jgi:hypothetical protein
MNLQAIQIFAWISLIGFFYIIWDIGKSKINALKFAFTLIFAVIIAMMLSVLIILTSKYNGIEQNAYKKGLEQNISNQFEQRIDTVYIKKK